MYLTALKPDTHLTDFFRCIKFKRDFRKAHPDYFVPIGTMIFSGGQGSGKTLSAVEYVCSIKRDYPKSVLVSNVSINEFPFNCKYSVDDNDLTHYYDLAGNEVSVEDISNCCIEYDGLNCLKFISNGERGVIYLIDELHLELNSLESKNIDIDIITEISQQRKQRKHIVGTSQVYMRLAKPLREQIFDVVLCDNWCHLIQHNKAINAETAQEIDGKLHAEVRRNIFFFHSPRLYENYDTFSKMKRYNKEWKGHKREVI